jgi:hypothetical protein
MDFISKSNFKQVFKEHKQFPSVPGGHGAKQIHQHSVRNYQGLILHHWFPIKDEY